MCEFLAGEVLVAFPAGDDVAGELVFHLKEGPEPHPDERKVREPSPSGPSGLPDWITWADSLEELQRRSHLDPGKTPAVLQVHLVRVPAGSEAVASTLLMRAYAEQAARAIEFGAGRAMSAGIPGARRPSPSFDFVAAPHSLLSFGAGPAMGSGGTGTIEFTEAHARYKANVGIGAGGGAGDDQVAVAVIDSGVGLMSETANRVDVTATVAGDPPMPDADPAQDALGHGSVVCGIIADCAPSARLTVVKVAESNRISEINFLAALANAAVQRCRVVNVSLEFGLGAVDCPTCGRSSASARSAVWEISRRALATLPTPPLLVAAAGNLSKGVLAYPARYGDTIAVGAMDEARQRAGYSNFGAQDQDGRPHQRLFFAPGGDSGAGAVARGQGGPYWGTSFACAYATALIANAMAGGKSTDVVGDLADAASSLADHDPSLHGHGRMVSPV